MLTPATTASSTSAPDAIIWKAVSPAVFDPPFLKKLPFADEMTTGCGPPLLTAAAWPKTVVDATAPATPAPTLLRTNSRRSIRFVMVGRMIMGPAADDNDAPDPGNDSVRRGTGVDPRRRRAARADGARPARGRRGTGRRGSAAGDRRRAAVRPRGHGWVRRAGRRHVRCRPRRPADAAVRGNRVHGAGRGTPDRRWRVYRDRNRGTDAGRRGRRRHGRGDRPQRRRGPDLHARVPAPAPGAARRRHSGRAAAAAAGRPADAGRHRRDGGDRCRRPRGVRAPRGCDPLDRQRDRRARTPARPRGDLRHQPLYAVVDCGGARWRAGG